MELYNQYRPKQLKEVIGQDDVVRVLTKFINDSNVPHAMLFTGPSGCGKTTLAGILALKLTDPEGIHDVNCGKIKPMEFILEMSDRANYRTFTGKPQVWILDEFQAMSRAPFAQQACLKLFEKPPSHAYFFMCSTDPQKILPTIRNRATEIKVRLLASNEMDRLLTVVYKAENQKIPIEVHRKIIDVADGCPRKALVLLEKVIGLPSEETQLAVIAKGDFQAAGIDLCKALLTPHVKWPTIAKILSGFADTVEPEDARRICMGYCRAVMLKNFKMAGRCNAIIEAMREPYYDVGNAAACLASSCYELCGK